MGAPLRPRLDALCAALPGAEKSDPWGGGHDAWKVGGRMFACIGAVDPGVSVKTADADAAAMLIDLGVAERAPYFHRSWIRLPEAVDDEELRARVLASYDLIRAGLPRRLRDALPPR